ncbi:MAG: acyltransferase [Rhodoferax sp.]|nr:acyltransferase [Rhodoferax sp.]
MKTYPEIYWLKAIAIITVVLIHALTHREIFPAPGSLAEFLSQATRFAVPFFLFATGFLIDKTAASGRSLAAKAVWRIGLPYLTASTLILGLRSQVDWLDGRFEASWTAVVHALVFGEALGIYYYVFVLAYLWGLALLLRRLPRSAVYALAVFSLLLLADFIRLGISFPAVAPDKFLWVVVRHPAAHLPALLAGWLFSLHYRSMHAWLAQHTRKILLWCLPVDALLLSLNLHRHGFALQQLLEQMHIFAGLLIVLAVTAQPRPVPRLVRFLADASLALYLLHLPVVRGIQRLLATIDLPEIARIGLVWTVSLAASCLLVLALQRALGRHSRRWFGA